MRYENGYARAGSVNTVFSGSGVKLKPFHRKHEQRKK